MQYFAGKQAHLIVQEMRVTFRRDYVTKSQTPYQLPNSQQQQLHAAWPPLQSRQSVVYVLSVIKSEYSVMAC